MPEPNFTLQIDHIHHIADVRESLARMEAQMSELGEFNRQFREQLEATRAEIQGDFDEMRRRMDELQAKFDAMAVTDAERADFQATLDELKAINPLADFPEMPPEGPGTEPIEPPPAV